jgi:hypothetical protein
MVSARNHRHIARQAQLVRRPFGLAALGCDREVTGSYWEVTARLTCKTLAFFALFLR